MLYDRLFRHAAGIPHRFDNWERYYRNLPVYDISDLVGFKTDDFFKLSECAQDLYRMPHNSLWMEYHTEHVDSAPPHVRTPIQVGVFIQTADPRDDVQVDMMTCYQFSEFPINRLDSGLYIFPCEVGIRVEDGKFKYTILTADSQEQAKRIVSHHVCGRAVLKIDTATGECKGGAEVDPSMIVMPLFAAMMLNCRNIVTEEVCQDKKHPMVKGEREHRHYCSYNVLKLEVPRGMAERNGDIADGDDDGPKQRFHLCRGHFKNLQHQRYKNKGWHWWPAHWRGSIELGRADKSYRLSADRHGASLNEAVMTDASKELPTDAAPNVV
jgi:hypothetical protein